MTFKKLFMLGGVLAGAAYLQNKGRRDRAFRGARDVIEKVKTRATEIGQQAEQAAAKVKPPMAKPSMVTPPSYGSSGIGSSGVGTGGLGGSGNYR